MIEYKSGNIFDSTAAVLVNPVNCMGISGAGLAKEFKARFRAPTVVYETACKSGKFELFPTHILIVAPLNKSMPSIAYFPTKHYYWDASRLAVVEKNLRTLAIDLEDLKYPSVAIPAVGCGLGKLSWEKDVEPVIQKIFGPSKILAEIYPPQKGGKTNCPSAHLPPSTSETFAQITT